LLVIKLNMYRGQLQTLISARKTPPLHIPLSFV
jgi:hypothetical protein